MLTNTLSWPELVWLLLGVSALIVNGWALIDARADRAWLVRLQINGARRIVADGNVRNNVFRLVKAALMIAAGSYAATIPPANPAQPIALSSLILSLLLLSWAGMDVAQAIADRIERRQLMARLRVPQDAPRGGSPAGSSSRPTD